MQKKYLKIIFLIIVALIIFLGLLHRKNLPYFTLGNNTKTLYFSQPANDSLEDYYRKAIELRSPDNSTATTSVTFLAVGDIMLSRNVSAAIGKSGNDGYPFLGMADALKSTDFNFGNLETPIAQDKGVVGGHSLIFDSPLKYVKKIKDYNFQILNLANNHAFDQGLEGLDKTKSSLDNLKILHEGSGDNLDEAWKPAVVEANGIKICFIGASYASINDGGKTANNYIARVEDLEHLQSAIRNSQSECNFTIVTMHAGVEYTRTPNQAQINFAHAAVDYGADVVIGAHPHWVQTIEKYCPASLPLPLGEGRGEGSTNCASPKYIFYSLGNFIFDQNFSQDTMEGLTLKISLSKTACRPTVDVGSFVPMKCADDLQGSRQSAQLDSVELIPIVIKNSQPRPATQKESEKILKKINQTENILK